MPLSRGTKALGYGHDGRHEDEALPGRSSVLILLARAGLMAGLVWAWVGRITSVAIPELFHVVALVLGFRRGAGRMELT